MTNDVRTLWLRRVLLVKAVVTVFVWGLPALLGPLSLLEFLQLPVPAEPIYLRLFGGACTAWGVAYWLARKEPARNVVLFKAAVVDNALPTAAIVLIGLTGGISSIFLWISALLTGTFCVLFLVLMPREEQAVAS